MKLPFGTFKGNFVHISEVSSGRTDILCPYCQQKLIAKKGKIKRHHFAHDGVGCTQHFSSNFFDITGRLPTNLPLSVYAHQKKARIKEVQKKLQQESKTIELKSAKGSTMIPNLILLLNTLKNEVEQKIINQIIEQVNRFVQYNIAPFPDFHLIRSPQFSTYSDGKTSCAFELLTKDRHEYFYPIIFQPSIQFLKTYHQSNLSQNEIRDKLTLFEQDLDYFQKFELYFLEIKADYKKLYKIGLTSRPLRERLVEIKQDLKKYYLQVEINPIFSQRGYAFLESFFKQKYAAQQAKIGQLTEYFSFSNSMLHLILKDLNLLSFNNLPPDRTHSAWIDWVYFNFNGKIYGYREQSVYIKDQKIILTEEEARNLNKFLS